METGKADLNNPVASIDSYGRAAHAYLRAFEGINLLPRIYNWRWIAWLFSACGFVGSVALCFLHRTVSLKDWEMWLAMAFEIASFFSSAQLARYKERQRVEKFEREYGLISSPSGYRRAVLTRIFCVPPNSYLNIVKEFEEYRQLGQKFSILSPSIWESASRLIYDPDGKARVLAAVLGGLAILVALFTKLTPDQSISMFAEFSSPGFWPDVALSAFLVVVAFGVTTGLWLGLRTMFDRGAYFAAILPVGYYGRRIAINYLMADLVRYHEPPFVSRLEISKLVEN